MSSIEARAREALQNPRQQTNRTVSTENSTRAVAVGDSRPGAPSKASETRAFAFRAASELLAEAAAVIWLVRDWIEMCTLVLLFGDAASCKTWLILSMAMHIAAGSPWCGYAVSRGAVFIIAGEGHRGLRRRIAGLAKHHGINLDGIPLFVSEGAASLTEPGSIGDVMAAVRKLVETTGHKPVLIVIDTLSRNFGAADENNTGDMAAFVRTCDWLREEFGCAVAVIHHVGHQDKTRARGNTTLRGAIDVEYRVIRDEAGVIDVECTKSKDFESPPPRRFSLTHVDLDWVDDEGQPVRSAAIVPTDAEPVSRGKVARGRNQTRAWELFLELRERERRKLVSDGRDPNAAVVQLEDWRELCRSAGINRQRFAEVQRTLTTAGRIRIEGRFVYRGDRDE